MSGNWKSGAVAMVTFGPNVYKGKRMGETHMAVRTMSGPTEVWRCVSTAIVYKDDEVSAVRPVVVIDPDDREQVERLTASFIDAWGGCAGGAQAALQTALRDFANPPKSGWTDGDAVVSAVSRNNVAVRLNDDWTWSCTRVTLHDFEVDRLLTEGKATLLRRQSDEGVTK